MSVYRGTRFLQDQLESIARQSGVAVHLHARDDGSSDQTPEVFENICGRLALPATIERGGNLGVVRSFSALIATAPSDYDVYAFSDQDDVWEVDKLARAAGVLRTGTGPVLVAAGHSIVDETLRKQGQSQTPRRVGLGNALVENVVQGAACALNREGFELVRELGTPAGIIMHDWWLYLVLSALGTVTYDDTPVLQYRQHTQNVVGTHASRLRALAHRASEHVSRSPQLCAQAAVLLDLAGDRLAPAQRLLVERFVRARGHMARQLALASDRAIWRQRLVDDLIMRLLIAAGRY